jgi:hypothetical protein
MPRRGSEVEEVGGVCGEEGGVVTLRGKVWLLQWVRWPVRGRREARRIGTAGGRWREFGDARLHGVRDAIAISLY